jgi:hypothetical protein
MICISSKEAIYTLLMHKAIAEEEFFALLMDTIWFRETVDLYFNSEYELKYNDVTQNFMRRGIVRRQKGDLITVVKP